MFAGWGSWVARFRWPVLAVALVAVVSSGLWGLGVFGQLTEGGYNDPNSESAHASVIVQQALGTQSADVVAIYTPATGKISDPALTKQIKARLAALPPAAVKSTASYWQSKSSQYIAKDKSSAVAVITLVGPGDGAKADQFRTIKDAFAVDGATVQLAGGVPLNDASSTRSSSDLGRAELISLPITLVLLLFIFGSLVAAGLPVLIGGLSVLGSLGILHAIASHTEVNSFAVNVASLLGLGMAIDYGLFTVGRFREEQAAGRTPADAVRRTVGTAGRTVVFSATLLMIALSGLLLFPQGFLKSLAYGGLSAVALAAILSLTLLPALLAVLGHRVDKLPIRLPRRRASAPAGSVWARVATLVLRRPILVALPILAILLLLASPVRGVHFGDSDERILPTDDPARIAVEVLKADYPQFASNGVQIVLQGTQDTGAFAAAARAVPGIDQLGPTVKTAQGAILTATLNSDDPYSTAARDAVDGIRDLALPPGASLLVGGTTARNLDSLQATADKLPLMVSLLAGATLLLMFLAFGSILLPIKAVLMSALSLSATFGVLVWIFEDGHLSGLLDITPAPLEVGIVVLMAAVVFGLSTDYEVFLLSRMVEARTRGATSAEAVTTGLARTGRVISAAALLLIVVTGAFALSAVTTMRFVGVGMIIALLLDATIVRMLLVPAVLGLLGDAAWWAPGPLRRLQRRAGLSEYGDEELPSGKHALPDDTLVLAGLAPPRRALLSKSPVPELLFRDVPSGALPALTAGAAPLALPDGPMDVTVVFPSVDASGLSKTVRIELSPPGEAAEAAETVDAELVETPGVADDLDATGILTIDPEDDEITDAEVVAEPADSGSRITRSSDADPGVAEDAPREGRGLFAADEAAVLDEPGTPSEAVVANESTVSGAQAAADEPGVATAASEPPASDESAAADEPGTSGDAIAGYEPIVISQPAATAQPSEDIAAYESTASSEPDIIAPPDTVDAELSAVDEPAGFGSTTGAAAGPHPGTGWEPVDQPDTTVPDAYPPAAAYEPIVTGEADQIAPLEPVAASEPDQITAHEPIAASEAAAHKPMAASESDQNAAHEPVTADEAAQIAAHKPMAASESDQIAAHEPVTASEADLIAPSEPIAGSRADVADEAHAADEPAATDVPIGAEDQTRYESTSDAATDPHPGTGWGDVTQPGTTISDVYPPAAAYEPIDFDEAAADDELAAREEPLGVGEALALEEAEDGSVAAGRADEAEEGSVAARSTGEPVEVAEPLATDRPASLADEPWAAGTRQFGSGVARTDETAWAVPEVEGGADDERAGAGAEPGAERPLVVGPGSALEAVEDGDVAYEMGAEADAEPAVLEAESATEPSDTPLFAGTGSGSYAALFPELFAPEPEPEPAVERYPDWSEPVSEDAFFAPAAADPFLYRQEPASDERYVTFTPADDATPEPAELSTVPTVDLSGRFDAFSPRTDPIAGAPPAPLDEPAAEVAPAAGPTPQPAYESAFDWTPPRTFEPAPEPPAYEPAPRYEPAAQYEPPAYDAVPEPAFRPIPADPAETTPAPRRPSDLSEIAAAWRQVIEHRAPITERPADLAGYVGQTTRRPAPEPPKPARPTDLSSYPPARREPARPADPGHGWPLTAGRRPETLGDQPPAPRRPASLADTPAPRRPRDVPPGDGPTRDLSRYVEQE